MTKVPRNSQELRQALVEQITLLVDYCESYDSGKFHFSKPMSSCLRVLLHQGNGHSHSLLHQLHLRSGRYFTVAPPLSPANVLSECNLLVTQFKDGQASHVPNIDPPWGVKRQPFPEWWAGPVIKGQGGQKMSRMDIVRSVADMDGGAHLDPALTPLYNLFRSGQLLGWMVMTPENPEGQYLPSPQYACIRVIAHETLLSLGKYAPWAFARPYEPPAGP